MCSGKKWESPNDMSPPDGEQGDNALPSYFSFHTVIMYSFHSILCAFSPFCIFVLVVGISLFKMAPKSRAKMLSSVPKLKETVMYLAEKIRLSGKCHSGFHYSAVGLKSKVN